MWIMLQTTFFQNWLITRVTTRLSKNLSTKVQIKHVDFALFNKMLLEGTLVEDHNNDTLLYAGRVNVRITDWFFLKDTVDLKYIGLDNATIRLNRKDSVWNYQFLVDYFSAPAPGKKKKSTINLNLDQVELNNVHFLKKDEWRGEDQLFHVRSFVLNARKFDMVNKRIEISSIA